MVSQALLHWNVLIAEVAPSGASICLRNAVRRPRAT
jgi:hypothetical protein